MVFQSFAVFSRTCASLYCMYNVHSSADMLLSLFIMTSYATNSFKVWIRQLVHHRFIAFSLRQFLH